jgi:hypothetical protein
MIRWVSPIAGAEAPMDLQSIPLAIDTNADSTVDVPWSSSGVLQSAGFFSGQVGVRGATLFLADADAGTVVLTAGWDGGPNASTVLTLTRPIVRPPSTPSFGTNGPDFEPNDPAGNAFRRDDVVPVEVDDLAQPMALFAKLDGPNARTSSFPVTQRCDAGSCWLAQLRLADVDFPAFRGRVLVWASGADGGTQTRPRAIPVTRWRWRRQVSGVPSPLSVTRPTATATGPFRIAVGSSDTTNTGRLLNLAPSGVVLPIPSGWPQGLAASSLFGSRTAFFGFDGGIIIDEFGTSGPTSGRVQSCSAYQGLGVCATEHGGLEVTSSIGTMTQRSATDAGCSVSTSSALALGMTSGAVVSEGAPVCLLQLGPPIVGTQSTANRYLRSFASLPGQVLAAAGLDGGIWFIGAGPGLSERLAWDGGVVDGIAAVRRLKPMSSQWAYWATSDQRVHLARYDDVGLPFGVAPFRDQLSASERLPDRIRTTPVVAYDQQYDGGGVHFVTSAGAVVAFDADTLRTVWSLGAGDGGIRGGRVDTEPIGFEYCGRNGGLLVPSSGDGSLYSFILDGFAYTWRFPETPWAMSGRTPENQQAIVGGFCTSD